jgi:ABC-type transporter Mla subunit MlaD
MAAVIGIVCMGAILAVVLLATSAGGSGGGYEIRAIFDDAGNATPGEDVKIDGVKVGKIESIEPTPHAQAAVVLSIENPGFQDFRKDASCTIRLQSLIGEKFVDCLPTQPRVEGTPLPPPLRRIPSGQEGSGQLLLPVANTHSPVDVDLLQDITRLPEKERLRIIVNELGAGLAGRGSDINAVLHRSDPALQELEKVLSIFASENKTLVDLAQESDRALAPLAADRAKFANFIKESGKVAEATARHRGELSQGLSLLPSFLRQFGPAMERLERFANQAIPTLTDLGRAAPGLNQAFTNYGPFSHSTEVFFKSLGKSSKTTGPALRAVEPLLASAKSLGQVAKPFAGNASELLTSVRSTGGLERLLDFIYLGGGSINGYDALGHFLRAELVGSTCLTYSVTPSSTCTSGKFIKGAALGTASAASTDTTSVVMARTLAVLKGMTAAQAIAAYPGSTEGESGAAVSPTSSGSPSTAQPVGGAAGGTTYYTPSAEDSEAGGMLLNYLLGG